jgi:hypothetical protein
MPHRALDAGTGKTGVAGVALALDRVVDDADGLAGAQMDGADGIEEQGRVLFEKGLHSLDWVN